VYNIVVFKPYGDIYMKKVVAVASEVRLEATAELKDAVARELEIADPEQVVDLSCLCGKEKCEQKE
jgi:hypothetical protein